MPSQSLTLSGKVYGAAVAQLQATTVDFGVVHVGDVASMSLGITNSASGALTDLLTGGFGALTGPFSGMGTLGSGLAAGESGSLTIEMDTSQSGLLSGSARWRSRAMIPI